MTLRGLPLGSPFFVLGICGFYLWAWIFLFYAWIFWEFLRYDFVIWIFLNFMWWFKNADFFWIVKCWNFFKFWFEFFIKKLNLSLNSAEFKLFYLTLGKKIHQLWKLQNCLFYVIKYCFHRLNPFFRFLFAFFRIL